MATLAVKQLQLAPLGAGDLIDRTVRLYRRHFMALIRASAPPVVVSAVGTVLWSVSVRAIAATGSEGRLVLYTLLAFFGVVIWFLGMLAQLIVMGGASRNLVTHLLRGEAVTARLIYRSVRSRFWGLLGATLAVVLWLLISVAVALVVFLFALLLVGVLVLVLASVAAGLPWLTAVAAVALYLAAVLLMLYVYFLVAGRVAYVPQVLMVEGRGVFESVSRSVELARGNVRRLMGMFLFTSFATYSAIILLLVPLGWVAYLNGVSPFVLDATRLPAWYTVSYQVIVQLSTILLAPVWMLGMSLLYVDERVRHEGYDIELMAAQRFGEMPALPAGARVPLAPALAAPQVKPARTREEEKFPGSVLGL
ncbi:MAG TPA: hypothetical protein VHU19_07030 [Pyrinomonadaceae bacterium]|nr:hypothetical protein [Pyrinomonadaceae bacterium]